MSGRDTGVLKALGERWRSITLSEPCLSAEDPSYCQGKAQLVQCSFTSARNAALLREQLVPNCPGTLPDGLHWRRTLSRSAAHRELQKAPSPQKVFLPALWGSGAILKPRFPGVKSQHLNSECQCSILLSATRLDCRPARESGLVAHWVTSHLFSSILCCHKFIPARCGWSVYLRRGRERCEHDVWHRAL